MNRQEFLKTLAAAAMSIVVPPPARSDEQPVPNTYVYKTAGGCELKADVYGADMSVAKPVIIWFHGGALIMGSRAGVPPWLNPEGRYVVVSVDYRLAPETKLPAIIQDVHDACRWVREKGPALFHIDPEKLAVAGVSAGGYLTLMTGICVSPRPRALFSLSGYGDITASWYARPSSFYLRQPLVSKEDAYRIVGTTCISAAPGRERPRFYLYCRQQGLWPKEVTGHDLDTESKWFDGYCPVRNVSAKYPPTVLIHGTADTDVPYKESARMDEMLSKFGVEHRFLGVPDGGHALYGVDPAVRDRILKQAMDFVKMHTA